MRRVLMAIASSVTIGLAAIAPASAQAAARDTYSDPGDQFYRAPVSTSRTLNFADLEASMPTDPLTWSSDPGWQLHRTNDARLAEATALLRGMVPVGMSAAEAATRLSRAGARCASEGAVRVVCRYHGAETPYGGEYWDNVLWRVWLDTADGRVTKLTVTRDWTRR